MENQFEEELPEEVLPEIPEQTETKQPVITYHNPRTTQPLLFVELDIYHDGEYMYPFGAISNPDDSTYDIYQRAIAGEFGEVEIVEIEKPDPKVIARQYRDLFLSATDRMTVIDYTIADHRLTEEEREELIQVRDEFRRWPQSETFPDLTKMPDMQYWLFFEAVFLGWSAPDELKALYGAV